MAAVRLMVAARLQRQAAGMVAMAAVRLMVAVRLQRQAAGMVNAVPDEIRFAEAYTDSPRGHSAQSSASMCFARRGGWRDLGPPA